MLQFQLLDSFRGDNRILQGGLSEWVCLSVGVPARFNLPVAHSMTAVGEETH